jgi:hypothetical protein
MKKMPVTTKLWPIFNLRTRYSMAVQNRIRYSVMSLLLGPMNEIADPRYSDPATTKIAAFFTVEEPDPYSPRDNLYMTQKEKAETR